MRQLNTNDVFKMSRILKKLDLKDIQGDTDEKIGMSAIIKIAENIHLAQTEVNDFLGNLCGITGEQFGELPIKETLKYIEEFKNLDGVADFFKYAGLSTK